MKVLKFLNGDTFPSGYLGATDNSIRLKPVTVVGHKIIFCTIANIQAPIILETFIWAVCMLLGIDSIMSPFYQKYKNGKIEQRNNKENT